MPTIVQLPTGKALSVRAAADAFLDSLGNPNTVRNYGIGAGKAADRLGEARPLAMVADDEIGEALELLWGSSAVNTWNARRVAVLSWLAWCRERGHDAPAVPAWAKRLAVPDSESPARSKEVHLREKTFCRMLYETAARAEEILRLNIAAGWYKEHRGEFVAVAKLARGGALGDPSGWDYYGPRLPERYDHLSVNGRIAAILGPANQPPVLFLATAMGSPMTRSAWPTLFRRPRGVPPTTGSE